MIAGSLLGLIVVLGLFFLAFFGWVYPEGVQVVVAVLLGLMVALMLVLMFGEDY